jgi:ESS family glutamate:Na+ symporter
MQPRQASPRKSTCTSQTRCGEVALNVFLAMSMMAIELWTLGSALRPITVVLLVQVLLMTVFAIANMDAVTARYGPSTKAFLVVALLVVPLVGAFFIDILNAGTINFFIRLLSH